MQVSYSKPAAITRPRTCAGMADAGRRYDREGACEPLGMVPKRRSDRGSTPVNEDILCPSIQPYPTTRRQVASELLARRWIRTSAPGTVEPRSGGRRRDRALRNADRCVDEFARRLSECPRAFQWTKAGVELRDRLPRLALDGALFRLSRHSWTSIGTIGFVQERSNSGRNRIPDHAETSMIARFNSLKAQKIPCMDGRELARKKLISWHFSLTSQARQAQIGEIPCYFSQLTGIWHFRERVRLVSMGAAWSRAMPGMWKKKPGPTKCRRGECRGEGKSMGLIIPCACC